MFLPSVPAPQREGVLLRLPCSFVSFKSGNRGVRKPLGIVGTATCILVPERWRRTFPEGLEAWSRTNTGSWLWVILSLGPGFHEKWGFIHFYESI